MPPVRLFIGNLPYQATEEDLRQHFSAVGEPTQIVRPLDRETGRARGFAFVEYADRAVAEEAIRRFDGQLMMGRPLAVSEARAREDRGPGGPRPGGPPRPGGFSGPRPSGPGGYGPRPTGPASGGYGSRPGGPGGGFSGPRPGGAGGGGRDFGPPAPPRGSRGSKSSFRKDDQKPRGPIPTKFTGRMYDLDDLEADAGADELPDFMKPEEPYEDEPDTAVNDEPENDDRDDHEDNDR